MQRGTIHERLLVFLLRFGGCIMLSAFGAMLLPVEWMAATHRWLGLGDFPASPLVDYLTRSIAALYGFNGGIRLLVSGDVRRYSVVVAYLAVMDLVLGVLLLAIDWHAGLPLYWTLAEGPPLVVMGAILLHLLRRVCPTSRRP